MGYDMSEAAEPAELDLRATGRLLDVELEFARCLRLAPGQLGAQDDALHFRTQLASIRDIGRVPAGGMATARPHLAAAE